MRSDQDGFEPSILPGIYRQNGAFYSLMLPVSENHSFEWLLEKLEPNDPLSYSDRLFSRDILEVEQHYAHQTAGLDVAFEFDTALFFATHEFKWLPNGKACYQPIPLGEHRGVIYCFRFRDPPVKRTRYLIKEFDLFKTYEPLRVVRQDCGLPFIGAYERNIALTDIDCIIRLDPDFELPQVFRKSAEFMFPTIHQDKFYARLLELKDAHPEFLKAVVEYEWARSANSRDF